MSENEAPPKSDLVTPEGRDGVYTCQSVGGKQSALEEVIGKTAPRVQSSSRVRSVGSQDAEERLGVMADKYDRLYTVSGGWCGPHKPVYIRWAKSFDAME